MKTLNNVSALQLAKETLAQLSDEELKQIAGGAQEPDEMDEECSSMYYTSCSTSSCPAAFAAQDQF